MVDRFCGKDGITGRVSTMNNMFLGATAFNQPIGKWDTRSVTDMVGMFLGATTFNQPISERGIREERDHYGLYVLWFHVVRQADWHAGYPSRYKIVVYVQECTFVQPANLRVGYEPRGNYGLYVP